MNDFGIAWAMEGAEMGRVQSVESCGPGFVRGST